MQFVDPLARPGIYPPSRLRKIIDFDSTKRMVSINFASPSQKARSCLEGWGNSGQKSFQKQQRATLRTIFLAGDQTFGTDQICSAVAGTPFKVIEIFRDFLDARDAICDSDADLFIFAFRGNQGIDLFRTLRQLRNPRPAVLVFEAGENDLVMEAIRLNVHGLASTATPRDQLLKCINEAANHLRWIDWSLRKQVFLPQESYHMAPTLSERRKESRSSLKKKALTPRQAEILSLARNGLSYVAISRELGITTATVKMHVRDASRRLCFVSSGNTSLLDDLTHEFDLSASVGPMDTPLG